MLVAGSIGVGYLVGTGSQHTTTTTQTVVTTHTVVTTPTVGLPYLTQACNIPSGFFVSQFSRSTTNSSELGQLAIVLEAGSNATVFVGYCPSFPQVSPSVANLSASVFVETCSQAAGITSCQSSPAVGITVASFPSQIVISNQTYATVAYFISAGATSKGHYFLSIPFFCPPTLLSVGYRADELNASDFQGMGPFLCPPPILGGGILGVSGANITYVGY